MGLVISEARRQRDLVITRLRNVTEFKSVRNPAPPTSVFRDFLDRARAHEQMGGVVSPSLFKVALWADVFLLFVLVLCLMISPAAIRTSGFFPIVGELAIALINFLQWIAWPLLLLSATGIALKLWARNRRTHEAVHILCAVESLTAVGTGMVSLAVVVLFVLELVFWIALTVLILGLFLGLQAAVIGALFARS